MGLNISTGNMYDFVTHTWNTVKGKCPHDCSYCYMKKWKNQKPIRLDEKEFKTDLGKGNFIFVGSSCDLFAEDIPERWIMETLLHCSKFDNTYLFQTKNPMRATYFSEYPEKSVFCTTIESNRIYSEMMNAPHPSQRARWMNTISTLVKTYVTIEPIMEFDIAQLVNMIHVCKPEQVNIGADSGNNNLTEPSSEEIKSLIYQLKEFTTVKLKPNLKRLYSE